MTQTARDLIARSISHTEIARADYSEELHAALAIECDDYTDTNSGYDYWGTDEDGSEWRVELAVAGEHCA